MIKLIIKGNVQSAVDAASARSIELDVHRMTGKGETLAETDSTNAAAVRAWFNEDVRAPFPAGTLLHFGSFE